MDVMEKLVELIGSTEYGNGSLVGKNFQKGFIEKIASNLIAHVVTVQEWVSVEDRLPTWRDGKVLVFTKYGFSICERTVNNRWQGHHANWITHWAYLPQPPKGDGENR